MMMRMTLFSTNFLRIRVVVILPRSRPIAATLRIMIHIQVPHMLFIQLFLRKFND